MAEFLIPEGVARNPVNGLRVRLGHNLETLTGTKTLVPQDAQFQLLDPDGAHKNVDLPAHAASQGLFFVIKNTAATSHNIVIRDPDGAGKETLAQNRWTIVMCDGVIWHTLGSLIHG